jgi:hypothetical protein
MNLGKTVLAQLFKFLPIYEFRQCIQRYQGTYKVQTFSCWGPVGVFGINLKIYYNIKLLIKNNVNEPCF